MASHGEALGRRQRRCPKLVALACLSAAFWTARPALAEGVAAAATFVHGAPGFTRGFTENRHVSKVEYRLGWERRFTAAFSLGAEAAVVHFVGERNREDTSATGVTVLPLVRWSFLRADVLRLGFDFGFGLAVFAPEFPPHGTHLNGYSMFGLSAHVPLNSRAFLLLTLREIHHSNGRGVVTENPAFDGVSGNLGAGFAF